MACLHEDTSAQARNLRRRNGGGDSVFMSLDNGILTSSDDGVFMSSEPARTSLFADLPTVNANLQNPINPHGHQSTQERNNAAENQLQLTEIVRRSQRLLDMAAHLQHLQHELEFQNSPELDKIRQDLNEIRLECQGIEQESRISDTSRLGGSQLGNSSAASNGATITTGSNPVAAALRAAAALRGVNAHRSRGATLSIPDNRTANVTHIGTPITTGNGTSAAAVLGIKPTTANNESMYTTLKKLVLLGLKALFILFFAVLCAVLVEIGKALGLSTSLAMNAGVAFISLWVLVAILYIHRELRAMI